MEDALRELVGLPAIEPHAITATESIEVLPPVVVKEKPVPTLDEDFAFVRQSLKDVVEIGTNALENAAAIARESEHPHAFEVLSGIISAVTNSATSILAARHKKVIIEQTSTDKSNQNGTRSHVTIGNAAFVGSTSDLQKIFSKRPHHDATTVDATFVPVTEEKPTEEKPTEEKPTEEKPTEEKPTEEKPT